MKTQIMHAQTLHRLNKLGWTLMLLLAGVMFLLASRYLTLNPAVYFPEQKAVYLAHTTPLLLHIVGAMLATILGPWQFLPGFRKARLRKVHRWLGRVYLVGVLLGGLGGLTMADWAYGGRTAKLGFAVLALLWLFSGWMAYRQIRHKQIEQHRQWMVRNYALTFAAVMLRLWLLVFRLAGVDFTTGYLIVAWLCWLPNLLVAEGIIHRQRC